MGPYLKNIMSNLKKSDTWKIQLKIAVNIISSKENDEEHVVHPKKDNIEIIVNDRANKIYRTTFSITSS